MTSMRSRILMFGSTTLYSQTVMGTDLPHRLAAPPCVGRLARNGPPRLPARTTHSAPPAKRPGCAVHSSGPGAVTGALRHSFIHPVWKVAETYPVRRHGRQMLAEPPVVLGRELNVGHPPATVVADAPGPLEARPPGAILLYHNGARRIETTFFDHTYDDHG